MQTPLRTCCGQLHGRARASPAAHARRSAARNAVRDTPKGSRSCFAPVDGAARAAPQHPRASYARVLERPSPYPPAACARVRSASTRACKRCPKFLRHVTLSPRCCGAPAGGRARAPARTRPSSRAATHAPSAPSPSAVRAPATGNRTRSTRGASRSLAAGAAAAPAPVRSGSSVALTGKVRPVRRRCRRADPHVRLLAQVGRHQARRHVPEARDLRQGRSECARRGWLARA